jgi:hypothetical protein
MEGQQMEIFEQLANLHMGSRPDVDTAQLKAHTVAVVVVVG